MSQPCQALPLPGSAYLLDSHVLLWWWFDPSTEIRVSAASVWELSLKHHRGKLPELAVAIHDLPGLLQADGFQALPISQAHGLWAAAYSQPHRDPFDRVLAAQAELERLVLLTADPQLTTFPYAVPTARSASRRSQITMGLSRLAAVPRLGVTPKAGMMTETSGPGPGKPRTGETRDHRPHAS